MKCEEIQSLLPDYWAGVLASHSKAGVEAHIAVCSTCQENSELWVRLGRLPVQHPSEALTVRFRELVAAYREGRDHERGTTGTLEAPKWFHIPFNEWLASWWPSPPAIQLALTGLALVIGLGVGYQANGMSRSSGELSDLREELRKTREIMTVSLLHQQSASDRLRGVNWTYRLNQPDEEVLSALISALRYDSAVDVRLAAADALRQYPRVRVVREGLVAALDHESSPLVQVALIDVLTEMREPAALPVFDRLSQDRTAHAAVRVRAERARAGSSSRQE